MGKLKDISADIGTTLVCCIVAYVVVYICGNVLRRCSARGKLTGIYSLFKKIGTRKSMRFVCKHILVFIILVSLFGGVAVNALTREKEPYIYIKLAIATQHDVSELFCEDDAEEEANPAYPVYQALHIDEVWLGHRIDTQLIEHYCNVLSPIYTKGFNVDVLEGTVELLGESTYATAKSRWLDDTKKYLSDYNKFFRPNSLYQASRGLVDFCLVELGFGVSTRIEAAADAVSMMDRYVAIAYRDGLENVTVQPNYVAHILGKLMLKMSTEIGAVEDKSTEENHARYEIIKPGTSDAMLLQAYIFFDIGFDLSEPGSKIYALTCYYKALAAQRLIKLMVKRQSEDDPKDQGLFNMLGNCAMENYDLCEDIYKKDPHLFDEELNVMSKISSNRKALEGWGFTTSAKDDVAE